jgi:hypothetical protein
MLQSFNTPEGEMPKRSAGVDSAGKRFPLNMRTNQAMRDKLQAAASESGRSLVQEVESRLERSFDMDRIGQLSELTFGAVQTELVVRILLLTIRGIETHMGARWYESAEARKAVADAFPIILDNVAATHGKKFTSREALIATLYRDGSIGKVLADMFSAIAGVAPFPKMKMKEDSYVERAPKPPNDGD